MKQGALIFDEQTDRYDIRFDLADYYGGLHCGETFDVMVGGRWRPTRIEMAENWYLVGIHADDLSGLRVRIFIVLAQDDCHGLLAGLMSQLSGGVEQFQADAGGFAAIRLNKYPNIFVFRKIHHRWPP